VKSNTDGVILISDTNQKFSQIARIVDEKKKVIVMKNNKPRYLVIDIEEYEKHNLDEQKLHIIADDILLKNINAFKRLARE